MKNRNALNIHNKKQTLALALGFIGLAGLLSGQFNIWPSRSPLILGLSLSFILVGIVWFSVLKYSHQLPGIKNNHVWSSSITSRGVLAWLVGLCLTSFYVIIYWFPSYLGASSTKNTGIIGLFDPLSLSLNGHPASQWFVYGCLYTLSIVGFGVKFILKYKHNKYQVWRTLSVMFFQLAFAFLLPELLTKLNPSLPYFAKDLKNMWPLNYYLFEDWHLKNMLNGGRLGLFMLFFGIFMIFIGSPLLTYWYGKRWYCSWVCGCGGLAETAGDAFRQLSNKSEKAWQIERWSIHLILFFVITTTIAVIHSFLVQEARNHYLTPSSFVIGVVIFISLFNFVVFKYFKHNIASDAQKYLKIFSLGLASVLLLNLAIGQPNIVFIDSYSLRAWYGFFIGAAFSGVVGVGFYPILGNRVWCRFGCPMAAILGFQQKIFSKFKISTNGSQCISCGNCSTYCEMGIDVRAYAQEGKDIVRSSCVGCGICSAVCPRGVLKLES
jgi:polyferredoxin